MINTENKKPVRLMDQVRQKVRFKHYSLNTERSYCNWIKQYILFHDKQHPKDLGEELVGRTPALKQKADLAYRMRVRPKS